MLNAEKSIFRINQVRQSAIGESSAYLLRTRLHRLVLSLQRSIAEDFNLKLVTPIQLDLSGSLDATQLEIVNLCNSILLESAHMSQPSEALDERWEISWTNLDSQLNDLERVLKIQAQT